MYKITYINNTIFTGGSPENSRWNEITLPIKSIRYELLDKVIILKDYESYNHLVERVAFLNSSQRINRVILMAKKGDNVFRFIFDLSWKKFYKDVELFGQEYNDKPTSGWKEGIIK